MGVPEPATSTGWEWHQDAYGRIAYVDRHPSDNRRCTGIGPIVSPVGGVTCAQAGATYIRPMTGRRLEAVVFDLDGVIRHYDRAHERDIEQRFGLIPGSLVATAFGGSLGHDFMCGRIDHARFADQLGSLLRSAEAAAEFVEMRAEVDHEAVAVVRALQAMMPVALLTNGSTRTQLELAEAGLHDAFHHVFNSAETGVPKPDPRAYLNVVEALGSPVGRTAFVDDFPHNVEGAIAVGMVGHHYRGLDGLMAFLADHGVEMEGAGPPLG